MKIWSVYACVWCVHISTHTYCNQWYWTKHMIAHWDLKSKKIRANRANGPANLLPCMIVLDYFWWSNKIWSDINQCNTWRPLDIFIYHLHPVRPRLLWMVHVSRMNVSCLPHKGAMSHSRTLLSLYIYIFMYIHTPVVVCVYTCKYVCTLTPDTSDILVLVSFIVLFRLWSYGDWCIGSIFFP